MDTPSIVGVDCRFALALAGLGTFTRSLVSELVSIPVPWSWTLFVRSQDEPWLQPLLKMPNVRLKDAPFPHYSFAEQSDFPNRIQDANCTLFFSPHFNVPFFCPVPFVCTVHDLILHRFSQESGFLRQLVYRSILRKAVRGSKAVLTVSEATKQDLLATYGQSMAALTAVVYPGVDEGFHRADQSLQDAVRKRYGLSKPFLLYVGNCKAHKNVPLLLESFAAASLPGVELVLVTGGRESARIRRSDSVRFIQAVDSADLRALYSSALACVTATLAEGFCIPLVEAMACRCPVMATNIGPIPEVCGSHALLVEPTLQGITLGLRTVVLDEKRRLPSVLRSAEEWSRRYSWRSSAQKTADVLRNILSELS